MTTFYEELTARNVDVVADAYIDAAEFADWPTDEDGNEEEGSWHADALDTARRVVRDFLDYWTEDEERAAQHDADLQLWADTFGLAAIGHDLWLTAARHGAGYWDRASDGTPLGDAGRRLTDVAHTFPMSIEIDADGWARLS